MLKAAIFDMDGTLLYTLSDLARSVNYALARLDCPPRSLEEIRSYIGNGVENLVRCALPPQSPPEMHAAALALFREHYSRNSQIDTRPYEGIPAVLEALRARGVGTAIVSNKSHGDVQVLNDAWFRVDVAIGESPLCRRKPAPDMVLRACALLGADPADCAYVGDTEVDHATAAAAGCLPVLVTWGYRERQALLDLPGALLADSPVELLSLLLS